MKIATFCLWTLIAWVSVPQASLANVWLCKAEAATGFIMQTDRLISAPYSSGRNYIVRPWREGDDLVFGRAPEPDTYILLELGDSITWAHSSRPVQSDTQVINLDAGTVHAKVNTVNGNFSLSSTVDYMINGKDAQYMPFFEVGRCSLIE